VKESWAARKDPSVPFISTNDILTQWLFKECSATIGLMAINLRGKVPECTNSMAGNFEYMIPYQPVDFEEPSQIRKSLQHLRRATGTPFPGFWTKIRCRQCVVSSWATNSTQVNLPGAFRHVLHLPVFDLSKLACEGAVIFQPRSGELAAVMFTTDDLTEACLQGPLKNTALEGVTL
jgi:hypothetical protein